MKISELIESEELPDHIEYKLFELMGSEDKTTAKLAVEDFFNIFNAFPQTRESLIENLKNEVKPFLLEGPEDNAGTERMYNLLLKSSLSLALLPELLIDEDILANPDIAQEISASFNRSKEQARLKGGFEQILAQLTEMESSPEIDQRLLGGRAEEQEVVDDF